MAQGRWSDVAAPWGYRIGVPWMASHLSRWAHLSTNTAFLVLAVVSTVILVGSIAYLLRDQIGWVPLLLFTPVFITLVHDYFLPDLVFAALVAVFFVLVSLEYWMAAAVLMLPLFAVTTAIPVSRSSLCE